MVNREEGLEAGGVAKLSYCSISRDNKSASKTDSVIFGLGPGPRALH